MGKVGFSPHVISNPKIANRSAFVSDSIARPPDEQNKGEDQANYDEHPVLDFESQNGEILHEKLRHSWAPNFCAR